MSNFAKGMVRSVLNSFGYDIRRYEKAAGFHANDDIRRLIGAVKAPVVLDVGANAGQSIAYFKHAMPDCRMHCFEPLPEAFQELAKIGRAYNDVVFNNVAVGSREGKAEFGRHSDTRQSSFLRTGSESWSAEVERVPVDVTTVDAYCAKLGIRHVHVLKIDTQGYDFEVMKGAERTIERGGIQLIYSEFIFCRLYEGIPAFHEIFKWLADHEFDLVSVYDQNHYNGRLAYADVLFASRR